MGSEMCIRDSFYAKGESLGSAAINFDWYGNNAGADDDDDDGFGNTGVYYIVASADPHVVTPITFDLSQFSVDVDVTIRTADGNKDTTLRWRVSDSSDVWDTITRSLPDDTSTVFATENLEDGTTYEIEVYITDDQVDTTETSNFTTSTYTHEVTVSNITSNGATFTTTSLINSGSRPAYWRYGIHGSDVWSQTLQTTADSSVDSGAATLTVSNLVPETRYRVEANLAVDSWDSSTNIIDRTSFTTSCLLYTSPSPRDRTRSRMPSSA